MNPKVFTNSHTRDLILNRSTRARNLDYAANAQLVLGIIMIKIDSTVWVTCLAGYNRVKDEHVEV